MTAGRVSFLINLQAKFRNRSQFLWFNKQLRIDNKSFIFKELSDKNLNFLNQLYDPEGNLKQWEDIKQEF